MLGFAWSELVLIGAVALVVIGPKDLPKVMRTMGQWSRKLRFLANDFQRHIDDMVREAELDEVKRETEKAMDMAPIARDIERAVDADGLERSVRLDEASAAADLPVLPVDRPPEGPPPADGQPASGSSTEQSPAPQPQPESTP